MSLLSNLQSHTLTDFPGADLLRASEDKSNRAPVGAFLAENVEYIADGSVKTRRGFGLYQTISIEVTRLYNWIIGAFNRILIFSRNGGVPKVVYQGLSPALPLDDVKTGINADADDAVMAPFGSRWFMAFIQSDGKTGSTTRAVVWNGLFDTGVPMVDDVLQAPIDDGTDYNLTFAEPAAGNVTAGLHKFALVFTTRNGYQTRAEKAANTFTSAGGMNLRLTFTPVGNWPNWVDGVRIAMTTVQNPEQYIFVGSEQSLAGGSPTVLNVIIDLDDTVIAATVDVNDATEWFNILANDQLAAPDTPTFILEYSKRMIWIAQVLDTAALANISAIYASEPADPQRMTADQHLLVLPGRRLALTAFVEHDLLYVLGPSWTYAFVDNNDKPATWPPPHLIDGRIGTPSVHGVATSPSRGVAWVASRDGLYAFAGGVYPQRPTSYMQSADWDRINWTKPHKVQVIDDGIHDTVKVLAPLDAAVEPSHVLSWNYKRGVQWHQVDYSLDDHVSVSPGSSQIVLNPTTDAPEYMYGSSAVDGKIYRQKSSLAGDSNIYQDDGAAIDSKYRTPPAFPVLPTPVRIRAAHIRTDGSGAQAVTVYNVKENRSVALTDLTPVSPPEKDELRLFQMESESCHYEITNKNTLNSWFELQRIVTYFAPWLARR